MSSETVSRVFLPWDRPLLHQAVDHLARNWSGTGPLDLSDQIIVVSTQQAGRRLREALSSHAAEQNSAVLPPIVVTPDALLTPDPGANIAGGAELLRVWSDVLLKIRPLEYRSLFPVDPVEQDFSWALETAADLLAMRATLGEAGLTMADAAATQASDTWREPERWRDLARIERAALKRLDALHLSDPLLSRKKAAAELSFSEEIAAVTLLAVPDPTPLVLNALRELSKSGGTPIHILIHAPDSLADDFSLWGVPVTTQWMERTIPLTDPAESIHLAADPAAVARIATELLRKHASPVETAALAVCDDSLASLLEKECRHHGIATFNPAGVPFDRHELSHMLRLLNGLLVRRAFSAFETLLRCPDLTRSLKALWQKENPDTDKTFSVTKLLTGCDTLQIECLPDTVNDAVDAYKFERIKLPHELGFALRTLQSHIDALREPGNFNTALSGFLNFVYAGRQFHDHESGDHAFVELASALDAILDQFDGPAFTSSAPLKPAELLDLLLRVLSREHVSTGRDPGSLDLQGWLEAAWEDAPHLIITGFNDRIVPEAITGDPFLPASARESLGLRTNDDRFARDAYFLSAANACRANGYGQVDFILAREREDGEPLRPSRLLFQCPAEELAERALLIFKAAPEPGSGRPAAWQPAWKLQPPALSADSKLLHQLRVTDFSVYLACPFRFYLKRGLKMEPVETGRMEMDARNFGTIVHLALEDFGLDDSMRDCKTAEPIAAFFESKLDELTESRFGRRLPAPLVVQLDAAKQRLSAAARIFAAERRQGWHVEGKPEWSINENMDLRIGELRIHGTIDRIERNEKSGALRVIDFKTSARAAKTEKAHLAGFGRFEDPDAFPDWMQTVNSEGKACRWTNLQVPVYIIALRRHFGEHSDITGGYFNLPRAIGDVGIDLWEDFGESQLRSATACAEGVASSIKNGVFWPPNAKPKWDDFSDILFGLPEATACPPPALPEPQTES